MKAFRWWSGRVTIDETGRQRRRHRSRVEADQLAVEYEASGLNQEAFCGERGLALKTLARYLARYRKQNTGSVCPRWVAAEVAGPGVHVSELAVLLPGGRRIEVKRGFDPTVLRQLMAVLEQA